jgi:hypothetical protein
LQLVEQKTQMFPCEALRSGKKDMHTCTTAFSASVFALAPSNGLSKYEQSLPNCWAVGGRAVLQAGADTLGPLTDAAGAVKQLAEEGFNMASMYYNNKAAFYSATMVNTAGTVGLLVPLRSSIYRGLLSTSAELGEAASGATLALFDYNLGKQIYNEITNPTPCR